jgi:hypothetical protein
MPDEPFVNARQLSTTSCVRNRKAIVMITKAWPRVRIAITPSAAAETAATTPARGTHTNGETSGLCSDRIPTV